MARRGLAGTLSLLLLAAPLRASALETESAERFVRLALRCIDREFPNKPEQVIDDVADIRAPREFHPSFFGCYDWHSSVHGHWMLARLLRLHPDLPSASEIRTQLDAHFSREAIDAEARYLDGKNARAFERPYGWAWTLRLAAELEGWDDPQARGWRGRLEPLANAVVARFEDYLPKLTHPIRTGVHPNTAFALAEALDYARATGKRDFEKILISRASFYYGQDRACPLTYEPSGEDFFSPCLAEADLMRRALAPREYGRWLRRFFPRLSRRRSLPLLPARVTDPTDPKLVHLDGLNLSRSWMLGGIAHGLAPSDPRRQSLFKAASAHRAAGLARVSSGNYEGEHWLASFAVYLLTETGR
ncbi:MAG TPA: DUF2891 domain-containing protein [Thermoanaerobaculia bacterium]